MNKKLPNTYFDYKLADGSTVKMTLNFYTLYQLKSKNEALYKKYNSIFAKQARKGYEYDELDNMSILYAAYVCANLSSEELMTEEEFLEMSGCDREQVGKAIMALMKPKN